MPENVSLEGELIVNEFDWAKVLKGTDRKIIILKRSTAKFLHIHFYLLTTIPLIVGLPLAPVKKVIVSVPSVTEVVNVLSMAVSLTPASPIMSKFVKTLVPSISTWN